MIFSISYELQKPGQNYDVLYETIESAQSWCHPMTSHWFIRTEQSVQTWYEKLRKVMDQNDFIFVVDITGQARQGWLPQTACDWFNENEYKKAVNY